MKNDLPTSLSRESVKSRIKKATAFMTDASPMLCTDVMPLPKAATKVRFRYFDKFKKGEFYWTQWFDIK